MGVSQRLAENDTAKALFPRAGALMASTGNGGNGGGAIRTENLLPRVRRQQPFPRLQALMEARN